MWLFFALLAAALFSGQSLLSRHVLRGQRDAWAFSFYFSLVGALVSLPFALAVPKLPTSTGPWLLALLAGVLIVANNLLYFKASSHIEASLIGAISKFRLVWVFILGVAVLHDSFDWQKLLGTLLAFSAGLVIIHNFRRPKSLLGLGLIFAETFTNAAIIIIFKSLLTSFNAVSLTFFVAYLSPLFLNFVLMPGAPHRIKSLLRDQGKPVLIACALGAFANLAFNQSLSLGDATNVLVINEAFLIVTLVGEHTILKEKEKAWAKAAAVTLAIAGAILIQLNA